MTLDKYKYRELLAKMESGNKNFPDGNYKATNSIGALGRYQFMPITLNALKRIYGLPDWKNASNFLNNPILQDQYFDALYTDSLNIINSNNLSAYNGKVVTGSKRFKNITTPINEYGMLAAIHLSGGGNLKRFFQDGHDPNDGLTSLTDYLVYFSKNLSGSLNNIVLLLAFIPAIVLYYA